MELLDERRKGRYISTQGLRNLDHYGYHGVDNSFFGNLVLKHWWNWFVDKLVPLWFAPNLLTLLGLVCNLVAYLAVYAYSPHLTEEVPRWVCVIAAVLIFLYQTLDNVDGKQARKTGSSSPLGELFDHGCDSITLGLIGVITGATVRLGGILTCVGLLVSWGPFYLAHWEEYHTGILIMGKFNGPTESQLIVIGVLLLTAIVGPWMWVVEIFTVNGTTIYLNHILFLFTIVFSIVTVGQNVYKVLSLSTRTMPLLDTTLQLVPFTILVVLSIVWLGTEHLLFSDQPHVTLMALSLVFAYITSRLIVNRVCKEPSQLFHGILVPLFVVAAVGIIEAIREKYNAGLGLAWTFLVLAGLQFVFFSVCIIIQLTTHLGIHAFKIVPVDPNALPRAQAPPVTSASPLLISESSVSVDIPQESLEEHSIE